MPDSTPESGDPQTSASGPEIHPADPAGVLSPSDEMGTQATAVQVVDTPAGRVRRPTDLLGITLSLLGIVAILFLTVFAHGTTEGVQADVRLFARLLARLLLFPVVILEGLVTLVIPFMVLLELSLRRSFRQLVESLAAAGVGLFLSVVTYVIIENFAAESLLQGLSVYTGGTLTLSLPAYVGGIAGLLTAAGPRTRRRSVLWSWNLLWITMGILLITAQVSLPGVAITLLLGRIGGLLVRYLSGVRSERAYGMDLVEGVRRAGFEPLSLVRVRDVSDPAVNADTTVEINSAGPVEEVPDAAPNYPPEDEPTFHGDDVVDKGLTSSTIVTGSFAPAAVALTRSADHRVYAMTTTDGPRLDVLILDGDRQVLGFLSRAWRSLRLRGIEGRTALSLRSVAERSALLMYAARSAGVRTPELLGLAEAEDSMLMVQTHARGAVSLRDVDPEYLTDDVLRECWRQLRIAHSAGLAHRGLTSDVVLVNPASSDPEVWLTGWESGDIASSTLARHLDLAQMLALLALRVGAERTMASASAVLPEEEVQAIGPLLQSIALPSSTRVELRNDKTILADLRAALLELMPEANVEPERLVRFGTRTILTITLAVVAVFVVITSLNFRDIADAFANANPWWAGASFLFGMATTVFGAIALLAFSPVRISLWRTTLTQAAASYIALAAPAGIAPALLNLRLLTRRGVSGSLAAATVALVQVSQVLVTVILLVALSVTTGDGRLLRSLPSATVLWALALVAGAVIATLLVPQVRRWAIRKTAPLLRQTWPRLSAILSQPGRLALGVFGNAGMTLCFVFAFDFALRAFGQDVSITDVAIIYLLGNATGAAVPTPGGIGAIEGVLTWSLAVTTGIPAGIAATVVILFRVLTYWVRIPIGWVAMQVLQRKGDL